jgi:acetoacetyl-CoA synthetase
MPNIEEGTLVWEPSETQREKSNMAAYIRWLNDEYGVAINGYGDLWRWSIENLETFWESIWEYYDIQSSNPYETVLESKALPGDQDYTGTPPGQLWFQGATLNYAEHVFRNRTEDHPALLAQSERSPLSTTSWDELSDQVSSLAAALRDMGVESGDRVVGFVPNIPQAVVAFLASASIGAIWSSVSPEFGASSVISRFEQLDPKVLLFCDGYTYEGTEYDRTDIVTNVQNSLPSLEQSILIPYLDEATDPDTFEDTIHWDEVVRRQSGDLTFEQVEFDHPLWVLFSSGTTGPPKPIVQGHGGIILEHHKQLGLQTDINEGDRLFWQTTTGWMMWNFLVGGLLVGATPILYDGSSGYPDMDVLWELAEESRMNVFGTSAAYLLSCMEQGLEPGNEYDLSALESIGQTGSTLPPEGFEYVYDNVKSDIWLNSTSGGTDVCTAFLGGSPLLPVYAGELQTRALGANIRVFNDEGQPVVGEPGELVITDPMPSMPIFFWNDEDNQRLTESYFEMYPGVWRHGDFTKLTARGSAVIYGRSDSVINKQGVRFGTSEIYSVVNEIDGIVDSLATGIEMPNGDYYFPLFVVLADNITIEQAEDKAKEAIRSNLSPRHAPDAVFEVDDVPRTLTGKKMEVPVKNLLQGMEFEDAVNPDAAENPDAIDQYIDLAERTDQFGLR